jgi:hypothetical protein
LTLTFVRVKELVDPDEPVISWITPAAAAAPVTPTMLLLDVRFVSVKDTVLPTLYIKPP